MLEPPIQDKRWWSRMDLLILFALGIFVYTPGLGNIPIFDRDEPRFATAALEMALRHDYLIPVFNGVIRPDKPPLLYWLMNASAFLFGGFNELSARMPSAIAGTLTLLVVYLMVALRFGRVTAMYASLILGTCTVFVVESRLATADATMMFFLAACMACAWQAWDTAGFWETRAGSGGHIPRTDFLLDRSTEERTGPFVIDNLAKPKRRRMPWILAFLFWVALAGGALTKGVPLIFVLVPMAVLSVATGGLAAELRDKAHLKITPMRGVLAAVLVAACVTVIAKTVKATNASEIRTWSIVLTLLLSLMLFLPRLPKVLYHAVVTGNWNWWRQLRPAWGFPLLIALILAWVIPAGMRSPLLLERMFGVHFLERVAPWAVRILHLNITDTGGLGGDDAVGKYGQPPGFFLATIWGTFWPWSILLIPAAYHAVRRVRGKTPVAIDPRPYQFLIAWIVPVWILVELSRGKLFHYSMPTFIAIAILCADALVQGWHRLSDVFAATWFAYARWVMLLIWAALAGAVLIGCNALHDPTVFDFSILLAGALLAAGVVSTIDWGSSIWPLVTGLTWAIAIAIGATLILPSMKVLTVSKQAGEAMVEIHNDYPDLQFAALGFEEPSLVYYSHQDVTMFTQGTMTSRQSMVKMLQTVPFTRTGNAAKKFLVVMDDDTLAAVRTRYPDLQFYSLRHFKGINPARGFKPVAITLVSNVVLPKYVFVPASMPATLPAPAPSTHP